MFLLLFFPLVYALILIFFKTFLISEVLPHCILKGNSLQGRFWDTFFVTEDKAKFIHF